MNINEVKVSTAQWEANHATVVWSLLHGEHCPVQRNQWLSNTHTIFLAFWLCHIFTHMYILCLLHPFWEQNVHYLAVKLYKDLNTHMVESCGNFDIFLLKLSKGTICLVQWKTCISTMYQCIRFLFPLFLKPNKPYKNPYFSLLIKSWPFGDMWFSQDRDPSLKQQKLFSMY